MSAQPNEELKPYTVEVDDHSDDCGTVYRLKGPNVSILSKDEEMLKDRAQDFNLGFEQGQALLRGQSEKDMTPAKVCPDCEGYGVLGHARDGRLISCETCGGHEDSIGTGTIKAIFVNSDKAERKDSE